MPIVETVRTVVLTIPSPRVHINAKTMRKASRVAVKEIIANVEDSAQTNGELIKQNAASTYKRKQFERQHGNTLPNISLVDRVGSFIKERFYRRKAMSSSFEIRHSKIDPESGNTVLREVQERGYTGWFGLGDAGFRAVVSILRIETLKRKNREVRRSKKQ